MLFETPGTVRTEKGPRLDGDGPGTDGAGRPRRLAAAGEWGPGVVLTPAHQAQAIRLGLSTLATYQRRTDLGNNRPDGFTRAHVERGSLAEYGAREYWGLPHDGEDRIGKPDLGQRTDTKGVRAAHHRLIVVAKEFFPAWRYMMVWIQKREDGLLDCRIMGAAEGTNRHWKFNPKGRDESTDKPRPCFELDQQFFDWKPFMIGYLKPSDL